MRHRSRSAREAMFSLFDNRLITLSMKFFRYRCMHRVLVVVSFCLAAAGIHGAQFKPGKRVPGFGNSSVASAAAGAAAASSSVKAGSAPADDPRASALAEFLRQNVADVRSKQRSQSAQLALYQSQSAALDNLRQQSTDLTIYFRENNTPRFVSGNLQRASGAGPGSAIQTAKNFFTSYGDLFRIEDFSNEFQLGRSVSDPDGGFTMIFQQRFNGLEVYLCELSVHFDDNGNIVSISATIIPTPDGLEVIPAISAEEAVKKPMLLNPLMGRAEVTDPKLVVFGGFEYDEPFLAWVFDTRLGLTSRWRNVVNAATGDLVEQYSVIYTNGIKGSGADGDGITRELDIWQDGQNFFMVDASKPMFDAASNPPLQGRGVITIYDGNNKDVVDPEFSAGIVRSGSATSGWMPDAVGASWGLSQTYDYFLEKHNRNSLDGEGGTIKAIVRYKLNEPNAFFIGATTTMVFGDLQPKHIDIAGHELAHGVTNATGNGGVLEYRFQPGALNESFSDVFAEMVELHARGQNDWKLFLAFPDGDRQIRDFINPGSITNGGIQLPSKMSEFVELRADQNNGGVHINSSIPNHCFYLLAEGMEGAIGTEDAARIFYRSLTVYMRKQSQFIDMRIGTVQAAIDIFGEDSVQVSKTREAFDRVEIFDAPPAPTPPPVPVLDGDDAALFFRYDQFFDGFLLGRREPAQGDGPLGTLADTGEFPMVQRTSVTGDGSIGLFVTQSQDLAFINTLTGGVSFAGLTGQIHSIAMSPTGLRYAAVLNDDATGQPDNRMLLIDLETEQEIPVQLFAPTKDGDPLDIIVYADAIDFTPNGEGIIYDALASIPIEGFGNLEAWTLYTMDMETQTISMLIDLDEGLDFGNPVLGHSHPNLIAFEVVNRETSVSRVYLADFVTGTEQFVYEQPEPALLAVPFFSGDDSAVIFSSRDNSNSTRGSLFIQPFDRSDLSLQGDPQLWLSDAIFGTIYRRGAFTTENQLPQITITTPTAGTTLTAPANFSFEVQASDSDGQIRRVEFYFGSQKVAETTEPPYSLSVQNAPAGRFRLFARAIDDVGASNDSSVVEVIVNEDNVNPGEPPQISARTVAGGLIEISVLDGQDGQSFSFDGSIDLINWSTLSTQTHSGGTLRFTDPDSGNFDHRFYRVRRN